MTVRSRKSSARKSPAWAILYQRGHRLMLHAACVRHAESGAGLVLVGESGMGKTTAAIRLCRNGFSYVTDETAALNAQNEALLYRKPLSVVVASPALAKAQHSPDALGMAVADAGPVVRALVFLSRGPEHAKPELAPLATLDALATLIPHTSSLPMLDRPLTRGVNTLRKTGGAFRLHYADIDDAINLLTEIVTSPREAGSSAITHVPVAGQTAHPQREVRRGSDPAPLSPQTLVRRGPFTEALEIDGEILVLAGQTVARLGGIGATIWRECATPQTATALTRRCVADHGHRGDAERQVQRTTRDLITAGLLVLG